MAKTVNHNGKDMRLGDVLSIDEMPFHYMTDQYGDQIALPCTERLLNTRTAADTVARGFIPLLSLKGRDQLRQGSFQALGADELAGPWGLSAGAGSPIAAITSEISLSSSLKAKENDALLSDDDQSEDADADDIFGADRDDDEMDLFGSDEDDGGDDDSGLDDLLAGFGDDTDNGDEDDEIDADLAALVEGL